MSVMNVSAKGSRNLKTPISVSRPIMVLLLLSFFAVPSFNLSRSQALAASPITSSGLNTHVNLSLTPPAGTVQYDITGGTRPGGGVNLFHSFGDFNVPNNTIANFLNDSGLATSNILGRVTGGNVSNIFGTIQTTNFGNANLFLMNPAGFLFGQNATVNVGGMVAFTSADYLRLANGVLFNATPNATADVLLSAAPVAAFGFLGSNPAAIAVQGSTLAVQPGQSISLVGGGVSVTGGQMLAPGGQINIGSIASPGEVSTVNFTPVSGMTMGGINLSQGAILDVSGNAAGTVRIRGGQFVIADATISADTLNANAAPIALDVGLTGNLLISDTLGIPAMTARSIGDGNAGAIQINSSNLVATSSSPAPVALIDTHTLGTGAGGNINIATGNLQVSYQGPSIVPYIDSSTAGPGHGGDVTISAQSVTIEGTGINAGPSLALSEGLDPSGRSGNVTIKADELTLHNGFIETSTTFSSGSGGDVVIVAENVHLDASSILTQMFGPGRGGDVHLTAERLTLENASSISTDTVSSGSGGDVVIVAENVHLDASSILTQTFGPGRGGDVHLTAGRLTLENASGINTNTLFGDGVGGDLVLNVRTTLSLLGGPFGGSQIQSTNFNVGTDLDGDGLVDVTGVGGHVTIHAGDSLVLSGDSRIASSTNGAGQGGTITIQASQVLLDGPGTGISFDTQQPFADMTITINILHPNDGDLVVQLESPTGTRVALLAHVGGNGADFTDTQFNDRASTQITTGSETFTGTFKPLEPLGRLIDQPAAGNWTLTVRDQTAGNVGSLESWTIQIGQQTFHSAGGSVPIPDNGNVKSTIVVATPAVSTVAGVGESTGIGGDVTIVAGTVTVQNGATLSATTRGDGKGGTLIMNATGPVVLTGSGSGLFSESKASGDGGNIEVQASRMTMTTGSSISSSSTGSGNAGNIQINAGNQFAMTNSKVTTEADQASGGTIKITTTPSGTVQLTGSTISASVHDGTGNSGSVDIDPQYVILQNSQILAQAVQGSGGKITINITNGGLFLSDANSEISAQSGNPALNGTVTIQSPNAPISGQIQPLGKTPLIATTLFNQYCAALAGGEFSSFTVAGRDSLPTEPGSWLTSPLAFGPDGFSAGAVAEKGGQTRIVNLAAETTVLSLRQIAPAGFLTQAFAVDKPAGCKT